MTRTAARPKTREGRPGTAALSEITATTQHRHRTTRDPRAEALETLRAMLVELDVLEPEDIIGLGDDLRPLTYDEAYPHGWKPGDRQRYA